MSTGERFIQAVIHRRALVFLACVAVLASGAVGFSGLPIEAYPNIAPLNVQIISQWPGRSTLEVERQITVPVETAIAGMPDVLSVRSVSLFGLSVVTIQLRDGIDSFTARQNAALYLARADLPPNVQPELSPDSDATGEVMRYRIVSEAPDISLAALKSLQDWEVYKDLKTVPGVAEISGFGGLVRQYQVLPDPRLLQLYRLTLDQLEQAVAKGNANTGGGLLGGGEEQYAVRAVGLVQSLDDLRRIAVPGAGAVPVRVGDVAAVTIGSAPRLGQVQFDRERDVVEGVVLMRRGANASQVLARVRERIAQLNASGRLPPGVRVAPFYDRQELLDLAVHTVSHTLLLGIGLVLAVLLLFLGSLRVALTVAAIIPLGLCVSFAGMRLLGVPANLISLGAIDFGLIVNAAVIVIENIMQRLERGPADPRGVLRGATAEVQRAMIFSTAIIIVAYAPLFLLGGVEGKIFEPMAFTMGLALLASIVLSSSFIPAAASVTFGRGLPIRTPAVIGRLQDGYRRLLQILIRYPVSLGLASLAALIGSVLLLLHLGTSFLPTLEENNLWIRVTLPNTVDLGYSAQLADRIRTHILTLPQVRDVNVQIGRPDDGTDPTGVFNQEYGVYFKSPREYQGSIDRGAVVQQLQRYFDRIPGIDVNFSQYIQDNVDEALSGVKGENSVKLFGDDLALLEARAHDIERELEQVPGIADVGLFKELGQPTLNIAIDRVAALRYGLNISDINAFVSDALGGGVQGRVQEGERSYDLVVRLPDSERGGVEQIRRLLIAAPDGSRVPLSAVAGVRLEDGPFFIYREAGRRYLAIKFGVRGRDLGGAVAEAQARIAQRVPLPRGYRLQWDGQFNEMKLAQRKLGLIIPLVLIAIFALLWLAFDNLRDAALVLINVPYAAIGGIGALYLAGADLSISAGIGFLSLFGIAIQNLVILITSIRQLATTPGTGFEAAVIEGAVQRFRSVLMTALLAALGLAPAAFSHAIGSQAQRPLALVVFGGMLSTTALTLVLLPVAFARVNRPWVSRRR
jgi:cobalt-zinc-cadmium resistance protein CzcA